MVGKSNRNSAKTEQMAGPDVFSTAVPARRTPAGVTIASSIEFDHVEHFFGERHTLKDVSFIAAPGEVVCLLGPSGSGKTTLLRLAAGLTVPNEGRVLIDGREVSSAKTMLPPEKRGVGLVFQDFALFPHLTVLQNVEFGLVQLGRSQRKAHAMRMLETVGIAHEAAKYPHALSGGEQQRVALARALAPKPGILLLDEPFSGLDARLRDSIRTETLGLLQSTRSTVLLVTHDPEEALGIADKIVLMHEGSVIQSGSCDDLYNHPKSLFAARFFTPLNVLPGIRSDKKVKTVFGALPINDPALLNGNPELSVCVRPGDFVVEAADGKRSSNNKSDAPGLVYVLKRRFLGELEQIEVVHQETGIHVDLRCPPGHIPAGAGLLQLSLNGEKTMVFPAHSGGSDV